MKMLARPFLLVFCLLAGRVAAQVASPAPLAAETSAAQAVPGNWIVMESRADQALQIGFPSTAAAIYREIIADKAVPAATRQRVTLSLVTALMDAGELAAAETALQAYDGPRGSVYQLRAGLLAITAGRALSPQARSALAAGRVDELPPVDRGWWFFLQAGVADADKDFARANGLYEQALAAAVSELQRVRFQLGQEQALLARGQGVEMNALRNNMERFQGTRTGYDAARSYATALAAAGRASEAQAILERQLAVIPPSERNVADQFRLMLGLIAGADSVAGRTAFRQLLRDAQRPDTQQQALQLLVRGAKSPSEREQLRRDLGELITLPAHPIIEHLLLARAQSFLADKAYVQAEEDARELLERYPASALKAEALAVRLGVAWDLKRYRTAAEVSAQLRAVIAPGLEHAKLGLLQAEAFFRAEDYRNAADSYEAALHEAPLVAPAGVLIFQRVLSEIRADRLEVAAKQLDEATSEAGFDSLHRWQAEWNLIKAMQIAGQNQAASVRIERLLAGGSQDVPGELRIRFLWLRAKLSFDNGRSEAALQQADELLGPLQKELPSDAALRTNVNSLALLLKAQALLALGRDSEGFAALDKLRAEFHVTEAAQNSYLVQADHLALMGDLAGAQRVLINFVDTEDYRTSAYAPRALYQAALILERQGLDRHLEEAYKLLERIVEKYPRDALVFSARLKQGDLMRKLNDFPTARRIYEYLINDYAGHPDELLAHLALADSLFAQGATSVVNYESASSMFSRLRDLPSAPVDLRVEAGFKWGYALAKRGQGAKAQTVFWSVVQGFLLDAEQAARLGVKGRYWLSRSLLELGQIHEDAGRLDEAQRAYQLIVDNKLSGTAQAQVKLARFRPAGAAVP